MSRRHPDCPILDSPPLTLIPELAVILGLNQAIVIQQVIFLLSMKDGGRIIGGEKWIWNTLTRWRADHFPFFSERTLHRAVRSLEKSRILLSCQPDGRMSRKKYYRVNFAELAKVSRSHRTANPDVAKMATSRTETTSDPIVRLTRTRDRPDRLKRHQLPPESRSTCPHKTPAGNHCQRCAMGLD